MHIFYHTIFFSIFLWQRTAAELKKSVYLLYVCVYMCIIFMHMYTYINKMIQERLFYIITSSKELMTDREIPLCKLWDVHGKNIPWGHFPEPIHLYLSTALERHTYICMNHCAVPVQGTETWEPDKSVCWQGGTILSTQPAVQAMLGNLLLGHATGEPLPNPNPSMYVPQLTSVKKPAIPAWHEPCSSPYFFLYSGRKKGRKQTVVIPGTAHTLHLSHLRCYSHHLERQQHAGLLGFISGLATSVHHAAFSPTPGSTARSQLGRQARVCLRRGSTSTTTAAWKEQQHPSSKGVLEEASICGRSTQLRRGEAKSDTHACVPQTLHWEV